MLNINEHVAGRNVLISKLSVYLMVFIVINSALGYGAYFFYGFQTPVDPVLIALYFCLIVSAYYVFVLNDLRSKKFKVRTMALCFLAVYFGMTVLFMSFIFNVPSKLMWYSVGLFFGLSYLLGLHGINRWIRKLLAIKNKLKLESITDDLTQLKNRRALAQDAMLEEQFASKAKTHISMLIIDIDDFKVINDIHGHATGDEVLCQISKLFNCRIRDLGQVYRWGGEEFVVLLPITDLKEAEKIAKRLIAKVNEHDFKSANNGSHNVSISIGAAQWMIEETLCKETLSRADSALYHAKCNGKNQVVVNLVEPNSEIGVLPINLQEDQANLAQSSG